MFLLNVCLFIILKSKKFYKIKVMKKIVKNNSIKIKQQLKFKKFTKIKEKQVIKNRFRKKFLIFLIKLSLKRRLKFYVFFRKKKIINILYKNIYRLNQILKNNFYLKLNVFRKRKNVFLNFSNVFSGNIYTSYTCGQFFKKSLRRTYFAIEALLNQSKIFNNSKLNNLTWVKKNMKTRVWVYMVTKGNYFLRGFKKLLREFLLVEKNHYKIKRVSNMYCKAHNGVKKKNKRRK